MVQNLGPKFLPMKHRFLCLSRPGLFGGPGLVQNGKLHKITVDLLFSPPPKTDMAMENPHVESEIHLRMMVDFSIVMLFLQGGKHTRNQVSMFKVLCNHKKKTLHGFLGIQKLVPKQIQVYI